MASITIHRGTKQIGGCVTEIATDTSRVFIDFGENLPSETSVDIKNNSLHIEGLTTGAGSNSALFLTHYHGDHIGRLPEVMPDVPVYMGSTAKAILLKYAQRVNSKNLSSYERINTFTPLELITIGDITVTPLMIDHSAFDAYMFVIQAGDKRILHTGDFRLHGPRGKATIKALKILAKNIDYIVCEGTTLSRKKQPPTEYQIQQDAAKLMKIAKYVFVLCSSTNIDRISAFNKANPKGRMFICDDYQKEVLDIVTENHADKSSFYDFSNVHSYQGYLEKPMREKGFCMIIKQGGLAPRVMERFNDDRLVIYSMWSGYLKGRAKNQGLVDFLAPYEYTELHTSGHASAEDIEKVYEAVKPKCGIIPIHTDSPELFKSIIPKDNVIMLEDCEKLVL